MRHSEEEKIKILYEDSLQDIRQLYQQGEGIAVDLRQSSKQADHLAAAIREAVEILRIDRDMLRGQNEQLLSDLISFKKTFDDIEQSTIEQNDISKTLNDILLGEASPMKELSAVTDRFLHREREATNWLTRANEKMEKMNESVHEFWWLFLVAGTFGGIAVEILRRWKFSV